MNRLIAAAGLALVAAGVTPALADTSYNLTSIADPTDVTFTQTPPLAGILAGLEWSAGLDVKWMISLPCDVVSLPADAFPRLLAAAIMSNGAYAVTEQGPQSLCAVWPVEGKNVLEAVLNSGTHPPVRDIAKQLGASPVYFDGDGSFLNVNTKDDLAAAERALSS